MHWQPNFGYHTEIFVITLLEKALSEIHVILWLELKIHKFTPCCTNVEACVGFMRHVKPHYNECYHVTMNTEAEVAS